MPTMGLKEVEHEITVLAPAEAVYQLIADVQNWPQIFPPTVYVDRFEQTEREERIRIWATANGQAKTWASRRVLDRKKLRIEFRQEVSAPPVASMGGTWIIEPISNSESRVRLLHDYRAINDDPAGLKWIDEAVDRNSRSELTALKANVERVTASEKLIMSFEDEIEIRGSAKDVYDFINEANLWTERLPHVARVSFEQDEQGLQTLEMDTRAKDGSTHTTKSIRVCFPHYRIAYKQITLPALMDLHTGYWTFRETVNGVRAASQHTVIIKEENIARILGPQADVEKAKDYVRTALSTNSRATLGYAKEYAEAKRSK
ncbi:aromatase/cyclase [Pendulispora rubella]|uniref:Aromatase/cyclase n=1 Tax=Pendulispora rubella TaxID=2741070 RepID=A0ABZ2L0U2_9BACT